MTLDGTERAVGGLCPIGTCDPVDICDVCRCIVRVAGKYAWHVDRASVHEAAPIVICARCGIEAEAVSPRELAEAWGVMLDARPVEGQSSWLE